MTICAPPMSARQIVQAITARTSTAEKQVEAALARIAALDGKLNSCTRVLGERALAKARALDQRIAAGEQVGPLAGVPFGAKDLFDIAGLPTTGGAASRLQASPASNDAEAIARMEQADAILVATCNMDEFAYGFATINAHHGTTRNPHAFDRLAGGSSGGSAAVVAAGILPLSLGSDTNGSIRVPASLCGVYGLKPTHGALPIEGVLPFVRSFDDIGPFAANLEDCALAWQVLGGDASGDFAADDKPLRVGVLGGFFAEHDEADLTTALDAIAQALGNCPAVVLDDVKIARSAAYLITAYEGGQLHLEALRDDPLAFDPATRARLIAGAIMPPEYYAASLAIKRDFYATTMQAFDKFDVLIAPATPAVAPLIDDPTISINGASMAARAHLGIFTQPLSFIGLPSLAVPLLRPGRLPLGVQLAAAPGNDKLCFQLARQLEDLGLTGVSPAPSPSSPMQPSNAGVNM